MALQYGLALQKETGHIEQSPISDEELNKSMLDRLKDSSVKEQLTNQIEEDKEVTS